MNQRITLLAVVFFFLFHEAAICQVLTNNGDSIFVAGNAVIYVNGDILNNPSGTFSNAGTIETTGNWINNGNNTGFVGNLSGSLRMTGVNQAIKGKSITDFYNLELLGTGIKSLAGINAVASGTLALNDRELATGTDTFTIANTSPAAITRTTGFVSSINGGTLAWNTDSTGPYLFPVGSSSVTARYRPVALSPVSALPNTYCVRLANLIATTEGCNVTFTDSMICNVNPLYYHQINRTTGNSAADITLYFDNVLDDGNFNVIARWQAEWRQTRAVTGVSNASPVLSSLTLPQWQNFSGNKQYALADNPPVLSISNPGNICIGESVDLHATGDFSQYSFIVNGNLAQKGADSLFNLFGFSTGTTISAVGQTSTGCIAISADTTTLNIVPFPKVQVGQDTTIIEGGTAELSASGGATYAWSPSSAGLSCLNCQNPFASPDSNTEYYVIVTDSNGCKALDSMKVSLSGAFVLVPNAFSPNGDGHNDTLYVRGSGLKNMIFIIYDRWGNQVFETTDVTKGWDGSFNGQSEDDDVFMYYLQVNAGGQYITKKGNITLLR